jgi:hypothetical protein
VSPASEPGDGLSAAERRLIEHLEIVKAEPPAGRSLVTRVVRSARIQRALREPLQAVAVLARAVLDGLAGLLGARRERRP